MAATFMWFEQNGAASGTPAQGTVTTNRADVNWKNADSSANDYANFPIQAGNNSFSKYQYGNFTGTFNQISSCVWAHTSGTLGTGLVLKGAVLSTYAAPSAAANASLTTDMTTPISITSGLAVSFSTNSPADPAPTTTLSAAGYTQYLVTQLQTTTAASSGDTNTVVLTIQYNET